MRESAGDFVTAAIAVRFVTIGSQAKAEAFCARHDPDAICLGDETMATYDAMGLDDFDLSKLNTDPALVARRIENEAAGFRVDWDATRMEDAARNPGAAAIDADGTIAWIYRGVHPGDLPPLRDMLAAARSALARS